MSESTCPAPAAKKNAAHPHQKNKKGPPRLACPRPVGFRPTPSPGHTRAFYIFAACAWEWLRLGLVSFLNVVLRGLVRYAKPWYHGDVQARV